MADFAGPGYFWNMQETDTVIILPELPMPPSVNAAYSNNRSSFGPGRIKTAEYRQYLREMDYYRMKRSIVVSGARATLGLLKPGQALRLSYSFHFSRARILTLKRKPKRNDTANRLKPLDDALATMLGVDDCLFWDGEFQKNWYEPQSALDRDYVDVTIRVINVV